MANLTISLDESIVRDARIRAIQEGTSLSAKVREFLRQYVEGADAGQAAARQSATQRLMHSIGKAGAAAAEVKQSQTDPLAPVPGTLRSALYADDFRQSARDVAKAAPPSPPASKPNA